MNLNLTVELNKQDTFVQNKTMRYLLGDGTIVQIPYNR